MGCSSAADPGFAKGAESGAPGGSWRARESRAYNGGLGSLTQRGLGPGVRGAKPPEAESFLPIFIQERVQKLRI